MTLITDTHSRAADTTAPILPAMAARWSPRGFDPTAVIDEDTLITVLEAARWAPSGNNNQPARFIVARRGSESFRMIHANLKGFNQAWADKASVLILNIAEGDNPWAQYDLGQAVAHLTIQAQHEGLFTHQLGGIDRKALADAFRLKDNQDAVTVTVLGVLGDAEALSPELLAREIAPRTRKTLTEILLVND
ncbi:nitroreductase [Cryobacterium adonitolivorans]|uniref:Nitroreductase n=1 Tax=Cryobacterium adonitolivorans TaxID=1259189 RepID=A0A4R8W2N9_9MICO|nr:nitroreductase family protein [Cryobacterium adonitolivorans]TFC00648.1 nitroreductase [Cryobacterium adonitolivorans]